jgi:AcrR family transcriptional regulator
MASNPQSARSLVSRKRRKGVVPPEPALSRVERGERSKELILEAAVKLFAERGYYGASIDEITALAGAKRSLVLYHFKTKLELWRAAVELAARRFDEAVQSRLARSVGSENPLRHYGASWLDGFLAEPNFARMLVLEGGQQGERLEWLVQHFHHEKIPFASPTLRKLLSMTVLRDVQMAIYLAMSALGPLMEASLAKATGRKKCGVYPLSPKRRNELIDLILTITETFEARVSL